MKDSTFQRSRFVFPLIIKTYDPDTDSFAVEVISEKKWKFKDLSNLPDNYFVTINRI